MSALRPLACWLILGLTPLHAADRLTSRPRPAAPADKALEIGSRVTTAGGEQRRVVLPDRSTVFVRENSAVTVRAESALELGTGEVFVETAPGKLAPTVVVKTPNREVRAKDTRFGVRADGKGSRVVVAAGEARVAGVEQPVRGGQVLEPDATKPTRAPRLAPTAS